MRNVGTLPGLFRLFPVKNCVIWREGRLKCDSEYVTIEGAFPISRASGAEGQRFESSQARFLKSRTYGICVSP